MGFHRKPYFIKADSVETVSLQDIAQGTAANKLIKTDGKGLIPAELIPEEISSKVTKINGLSNNIKIAGTGLVKVTSSRSGNDGVITISASSPGFYPTLSSATSHQESISVFAASEYNPHTVLAAHISTSCYCDMLVSVSAKVEMHNSEWITPSIVIGKNSYEIPQIESSFLSFTHIFANLEPCSSRRVVLAVKSKPKENQGTLIFRNISISVSAFPRVS